MLSAACSTIHSMQGTTQGLICWSKGSGTVELGQRWQTRGRSISWRGSGLGSRVTVLCSAPSSSPSSPPLPRRLSGRDGMEQSTPAAPNLKRRGRNEFQALPLDIKPWYYLQHREGLVQLVPVLWRICVLRNLFQTVVAHLQWALERKAEMQ